MQEGDTRYLAYMEHRRALIDYVTGLVGSRADAEDIVQDAYLRLVPRNGIASGALKAYLFQIVRNLALDLRRRRKLELDGSSLDLPHWTRPQELETPERQAMVSDEVLRIHAYLEGLPQQTRTTIEMYRFGGYTMEEIAAHLEISVASVHRILRKSLAAMSELVEREGVGPGKSK